MLSKHSQLSKLYILMDRKCWRIEITKSTSTDRELFNRKLSKVQLSAREFYSLSSSVSMHTASFLEACLDTKRLKMETESIQEAQSSQSCSAAYLEVFSLEVSHLTQKLLVMEELLENSHMTSSTMYQKLILKKKEHKSSRKKMFKD